MMRALTSYQKINNHLVGYQPTLLHMANVEKRPKSWQYIV